MSEFDVRAEKNILDEKVKDVLALNEQAQAAGVFVDAAGLYPTRSATTIRVHDGEVLTTDGPFAETKEQLGGFWIIDVPDLDAALAWAAKGARACGETIEVRPFQESGETWEEYQKSNFRNSHAYSVTSPPAQ